MGSPNGEPTANPVELIDEAAAIKLVADRLYARYNDLAGRAAALLGRGTVYPTLPDGTEIAQFTVPSAGITVTITDESALTEWMRTHYPTEVATVEVIRPAFLDKLRKACREAKSPVGPDGEVDVPGIAVSTGMGIGSPRLTPTDEGRARAEAAVAAVLDRALEQFATAVAVLEVAAR
jgi:hypothetical protein